MKYFVISDIHSHYDAMITALKKSGYNPDIKEHHLMVLGDLFDRGDQVIEVLNYLYKLHSQKKATIIIGNHDIFLIDFLQNNHKRVLFNIQRNGFGKTLECLSGLIPGEDNLQEVKEVIITKYPFLLDWLKSFPLYLEIGEYIFVHGGIDGGMLDWKSMSTTRDFVWNREIDLPKVPGKTVVAGHHRVATIRVKTHDYHLLFLHDPSKFDILYDDGKILIDRFVEKSNEINVLTLEL